MSEAEAKRIDKPAGTARATLRAQYARKPTDPVPRSYRVLRAIFVFVYRTFFRTEVLGLENVPDEGAVLFLSNHASFLDPPLVGGFVPREVHFLARSGILRWPIAGRILAAHNVHSIRRGAIDRKAIQKCREILSGRWGLVLFPEGTRSEDGKPQRPKGGVGMILEGISDDVQCVPVRVVGTHHALGRSMMVPRLVKLQVIYGKPFKIEDRTEDESRRAFYERCTNAIEESWAGMGLDDDRAT